ncbi:MULTISPECIES: isochorismatase family protein [Methylobacterium]|uniref:isochorismatase family protein n=1 Tax=Methylobacterium TaxID=407 RepID=UPI0013EE2C78|nr:isochorismatase family protein [Methylobacterium sp. DB0501]NGM37047.1 isochorismatase family protein [Methylobacterium sp. DB0501]
MPQLVPADVAVLFADLQDSIVGHAATTDEARLRKSAGALAGVARDLGLPAFASVVPFGTDDPRPIAEITAVLPDIPVLTRGGPAVFAHAPSREALLGTGRRVLAIAGVASEVVVLHAALAARAAGLDVHVLLDASGGFSDRTEAAALREIEAAGGITSSVASFATRFADTFETREGQAAMGALVRLMG